MVPGVLVGHFTQLAWAQTWRIGCGKITYISKNHLQNNEVTGQQLYICNYGVAGNFIRSEMYQKGDPCSQCPAGTSCSSEYPGLCSGTPDQPLTIRPPIILPEDFAGFPTSQSGSNNNGGSNGNIQIPGGFLTVNPPPVIGRNLLVSDFFFCGVQQMIFLLITFTKILYQNMIFVCESKDIQGVPPYANFVSTADRVT